MRDTRRMRRIPGTVVLLGILLALLFPGLVGARTEAAPGLANAPFTLPTTGYLPQSGCGYGGYYHCDAPGEVEPHPGIDIWTEDANISADACGYLTRGNPVYAVYAGTLVNVVMKDDDVHITMKHRVGNQTIWSYYGHMGSEWCSAEHFVSQQVLDIWNDPAQQYTTELPQGTLLGYQGNCVPGDRASPGVGNLPTNFAPVHLHFQLNAVGNPVGGGGCHQYIDPSPYLGLDATACPQTFAPPQQAAHTATVLVMDVSGSMSEPWQGGVKIVSAIDAGSRLVRQIRFENEVAGSEMHRLALVRFSSAVSVDAPLGTDLGQVLAILGNYAPEERTNMGEGLILANGELAGAQADEARIMIVLTDGMTNEGLSEADILAGPVAEAARNGTCIYTVGFGDSGNLNEPFLEQVARQSGCGEYFYASDAESLLEIYVRLRHESTGDLVFDDGGTIGQGDEEDVGTIPVPPGRGELHVTLDWPGSTLELRLRDPQGQLVDDTYPGARIMREAAAVYAVIQNPMAGDWTVGLYGADVPEGTTSYYVAASLRGTASATPTPTAAPTPVVTPIVVPPPSGGGMGWVLIIVGVVVLVVVVLAVTLRRGGQPAGPALAVLYVQAGPAGQPSLALGQQTYSLGREAGNHLVLMDPQVSRNHAQVSWSNGSFYVMDMGSVNGTTVNQVRLAPMQWHPLRDGDVIQIASHLLVFRQGAQG